MKEIIEAVQKTVGEQLAPVMKRLDELEKTPVTGHTRGLPGAGGAAQPGKASNTKAARLARAAKLFAETDPAKGKGLAVGAIIRATLVAHQKHAPVYEVLGHWGYEEYAEEIKAFGGSEAAEYAKALGESSIAAGGALVAPVYSSELIELLRAKLILATLGIRQVPMPGGTLNLSRQTSASSASYYGESVASVPSTPGTGVLGLSAKKLMGTVIVTNELLQDASIAADAFVRDDMVAVLKRRAELAMIRGTGSAHEPRGLRHWAGNTVAATGGATPTLDQVMTTLLALQGFLEDNDVPVDIDACAFLLAPRTKRYLMSMRDGTGPFVFREEMMGGRLNGYRFGDTTAIPIDLGDGSDESEIYFVNVNECIEGVTSALELDAVQNVAYDDSGTVRSGFSRDETGVRGKIRHDFALRHADACAVGTAVQWGDT